MTLDSLRRKIDRADRDLLDALARRMETVDLIIDKKQEDGLPIFDSQREKFLLAKMAQLAEAHQVDPRLVERVLREVISHSRDIQTRRVQEKRNPQLRDIDRIAYQGGPGAYSWTACRRFFGEGKEPIGYESFRGVVEALESKEVDVAVLPIENTLVGSIHQVYDLLGLSGAHVVGEEVIAIDHCLLGLEKVPLERIQLILSHPAALQQCGAFLHTLSKAKCEAYIDTAEAALKVRKDGDPYQAAIASREAAARHDLRILKEQIADHPDNHTRFWVVAREAIEVDSRIPAKTSLLLVTDHQQGALFRCLAVLADAAVNMTKLESRPRPGVSWQSQFYLDVEGNIHDQRFRETLEAMREKARLLRVLGCYPRAEASVSES